LRQDLADGGRRALFFLLFFGQAVEPVLVMDDLPVAFCIFHQCGEAFHPVAGVEVFNAVDLLYGRLVNVSTDNAMTFAGAGHFYQLVLKIRNKGHRRFNFGFYHLRKGIIRQPAFFTVSIVMPVQVEQKGIPHIAQLGDPFEAGGDVIEQVAVGNKIFFLHAIVHIIFFDGKVADLQGHDLLQEIIVVASQVNDLTLVFGSEADEVLEEITVLLGPAAAFAELPAVNNIAVEDEGLAFVLLEKVQYFFGFAGFDPKVNVRKHNRFVKGLHAEVFYKYGQIALLQHDGGIK
jgi:hypothetical protein